MSFVGFQHTIDTEKGFIETTKGFCRSFVRETEDFFVDFDGNEGLVDSEIGDLGGNRGGAAVRTEDGTAREEGVQTDGTERVAAG